MKIAFVGTGFVCDYYLRSLPYNPDIELVAVHDLDSSRANTVATNLGIRAYDTLEELLADDEIQIVANLTNPKAHYEVSKACLEAGKHVYSEKPLADDYDDAKALVALARENDLLLSSAPCSLLSETAQTIWKSIRDGEIGTPRLVYAELDDGPIHKQPLETWISSSGFPWPYVDEFEVGCTVEHAGYYLTWLTAYFGPARRVTGFAAELIPHKTDTPYTKGTPDFSVGLIEWDSGVVCRITNGIVAPHDHDLLIVGDDANLELDEAWNYRRPFKIRPYIDRHGIRVRPWLAKILRKGPRTVKPIERPEPEHGQEKPLDMMDFCRGISDMAEAIRTGREPHLSAEHALHVTELTLAIQHPEKMGTPRMLESTFAPIQPVSWAR